MYDWGQRRNLAYRHQVLHQRADIVHHQEVEQNLRRLDPKVVVTCI
jgi:hypothetical protein